MVQIAQAFILLKVYQIQLKQCSIDKRNTSKQVLTDRQA